MNDLALSASFVGFPNWHVIRWISRHIVDIGSSAVVLFIVLCIVLIIWAIRPFDLWKELKKKKFVVAVPALFIGWQYLLWLFKKIWVIFKWYMTWPFPWHWVNFLFWWFIASVLFALWWSWSGIRAQVRKDE